MQHLMNFKELDTREYIDENDFHKNIILKNSKPLTKKEREKTQAMLTILSTINNREYFVYFDDTDELMYIKSLYEMSIEKEFTKEKEQTYLAFREFMGNLPFYTKDEDIIHLIITKMPTSSFIYNTLKMSSYINERDEKVFTKYRLPILNILLYLLKNGLFEQYYNFIRDLEMDVISIFYNTYEEEIKSAIKKYYPNSNILYLFVKLNEPLINRFFTSNLLNLFANASSTLIMLLVKADIPKKYIMHGYFKEAFKKCNYEEQIIIIEDLEEREFPLEFTRELKIYFNRPLIITKELLPLDISKSRFNYFYEMIKNSSYFNKNNLENTPFWQLIEDIKNGKEVKEKDFLIITKKLIDLYQTCKNNAHLSIVNGLTPIPNLSSFITYMEKPSYNIFVIGDDYGIDSNATNLDNLFDHNNYALGHIITEKNFSRMNGSRYFFAFNLTSYNLISAYTREVVAPYLNSKYAQNITITYQPFLDLYDINRFTLQKKTFSQICVKVRDEEGHILRPACLVCFDKVKEHEEEYAKRFNQKILVLRKNKDTLENCDVRSYRGCAETDF